MKRSIWMLLLWIIPLATILAANVPTAQKNADLANTEVKTGGQFRVIRLEGEDTDSDLHPRQWDITVYDTQRGNHATTVRFKDGVAVSLAGAVRVFDDARWTRFGRNFTGYDPSEIIQLARWKLDSPDVLNRIAGLPGMDKTQITDVKMALRKLSDGDVAPIWRVKVKARSKLQPGREGWIGIVELSAETGEVIQNSLRPERLTN
jgi:hypothetical protein